MRKCKELYKQFQQTRKNHPNDHLRIDIELKQYQEARNLLNKNICKEHEKKFTDILKSNNTKKLWNEINWSGKYKAPQQNMIHVDTMADYFEQLYQPLDAKEEKEFDSLHTEMYIPITDDPITHREVVDAAQKMKKGGWDYSMNVLKLSIEVLSGFLILLFNTCFFVAYPVKLTLSILHALPKKGNLKLLKNYRGIQIQPLLGLLYDRILCKRLLLWAKFRPEQSAFKKGKGKLDQTFLLRTIISFLFFFYI